MKRSKRFEILDTRPVNKDGFSKEWIDAGFVAMESSNDPVPSIRIEKGIITELDGKRLQDFDLIDLFIARYGINLHYAEKAMALDSLSIARKLVDINVTREEIVTITTAITPAKIVDVIRHLNVVEMMMAQMKMRTRKTPSNQAHATNIVDNPVLIAADAAEAARRGFAELETTCAIARYAPFNAISLLVGGQTGRGGILNQCSMEEATELELGMRGFVSYAETLSVYGTENALIDGDDTPWSKAFLASAYASRGIKMRFTSGTGSEALMGNAEKKSMLYLEARCIYLTKAAGVQGLQNGSISCIPMPAALPSGFRAIAAENLIASMLDLEVASGNDTTFSHSDMRRSAKLLMQLLPGTDFICSGYGAIPNFDNTFAGSNTDCDDYDDYYIIQRDMKVDGGIKPITEEDAVNVRRKAARACQAVFQQLGLPAIGNEEVEAAVYAHSYRDMPPRNMIEDMQAAKEMMKRGTTGFDIVRALHERGFEDVACNVLNLLKTRISGDYLHTAAIFDKGFNVISAVNDRNDYSGPGTGYRISKERWEELQVKETALDPLRYSELNFIDYNKLNIKEVSCKATEMGTARVGAAPDEVVIAVSPSFGTSQRSTIVGIPLGNVLKELMAGIEEEGLRSRIIKFYNTSDIAAFASSGAKLSGSGIAIGMQSKGTAVIHQSDLAPLDNLELFPQAPLYTPDIYRQIGKNAAQYAKGQTPNPIPALNDQMAPSKYMVRAAILHIKDTKQVKKGSVPVELKITFE